VRRRAGRADGGLDAGAETRGTALYAVAAAALAVVAVFALAEPARSLISPLAVSFLLTVAVSMMLALTVTPALGALLLGRERPRARMPRRVVRWQTSATAAALARPRRVLAGVVGLMAVTVLGAFLV